MTQPDFAARNQVDVLVRERRDALTVRWLIHTGGIGACAVLLAILARTSPEPLPAFVTAAAWVLGAVLAALSVVLPRRRLTDQHLSAWLRGPADAYRWSMQMQLTAEQKDAFVALPPAEQSVCALTILFEPPYRLGLMLAAGVALVGLGYGLMTHTLIEAAPFLLAGLALNCWHYPRMKSLIERGRTLQSAAQDEHTLRQLVDMQRAKDKAADEHARAKPQPKPQPRAATQPRLSTAQAQAQARPQRKTPPGKT